jgi:hypothetical protein
MFEPLGDTVNNSPRVAIVAITMSTRCLRSIVLVTCFLRGLAAKFIILLCQQGVTKGRTRRLHPACWSVCGRREHFILVVTIPWVHI